MHLFYLIEVIIIQQEVFQSSKIWFIIIFGVAFVGVTIATFVVELPLWASVLVLVIGVSAVLGAIKTKIIVHDSFLYYDTLFGRKEEVDLKKVPQIVIREVETIVDRTEPTTQTTHNRRVHAVNEARQVSRIMYVLDKDGRTIFSFPASLIRFSDRNRFRQAVQAVNPEIETF